MIVRKTIPLKGILLFAGHHFIWLIAYMLLATILYKVVGWHRISISLLPVSLIGTAVAFDVGFKNNQSYDRVWEARKIWGSIVNSSRSWGALVSAYVRNNSLAPVEIQGIKTALIYRHIAWLEPMCPCCLSAEQLKLTYCKCLVKPLCPSLYSRSAMF